jgi:hypothetical protein
MAGALPRVMATGAAVGAEPALAMALFSYISRQTGDPHLAATSATAIMFGLGKPPKQLLGKMRALGFDPSGTMLEKIQWLGGADLPEEVAMALGGRRGIVALSALARRPEEFMRGLEEGRAALAAPGSLFEQRLAGLYGEVPSQRMLDQMAKMDVLAQRQRVQPDTLRRKMLMDFTAVWAREGGMPAIGIDLVKAGAATYRYTGMGWAWEKQARMMPGIDVMYDLLEAGYTPEDVLEIVNPALKERGGMMWHAAPDWGILTPGVVDRDKLGQEMRELLKSKGRGPMQEGGTIIQNPGVVHVHPAGPQGATPNPPDEANP